MSPICRKARPLPPRAPLKAVPTAARPTRAGRGRRSPRLAHLEDEERAQQQPGYEDAEDDRIAARKAEYVGPGVESIQQRAGQEAGDHARPGGGEVREAEEEARLIARDPGGDEGPTERAEGPQAAP